MSVNHLVHTQTNNRRTPLLVSDNHFLLIKWVFLHLVQLVCWIVYLYIVYSLCTIEHLYFYTYFCNMLCTNFEK